jgi:hypothetical protein
MATSCLSFSQYQSYFQQIALDQCSNQIGGSMVPETISRIILAFSLGIIAAGMLSLIMIGTTLPQMVLT